MKHSGFKIYLLIWLGTFISEIGTGMTSFALGIYIYQLTGQAASSALVTLCAFLPGLLMTPLAGILADRYDRRLLMALGDGLSGLGVLWIYFSLQTSQPSLLNICLGAAISSVFSALVNPAFRATISDLVPKDQISKATGLSQINGIARYLISPSLAGLILAQGTIGQILLIDFSTIFVTVICSLIARRHIKSPRKSTPHPFWSEFIRGFQIIHEKRGIWLLVLLGTAFSFFLGTVEILLSPMILGFASSQEVGWTMAISSSGMLLGGLILGIFSIKRHFHLILSLSLGLLGIFMAGMGSKENLVWICFFGFLLFMSLPFANTAIDYLIRLNIDKSEQGKAWGTIGIISQFGYVIAYASMGWVADSFFKPLLLPKGALATWLGSIIGTGSGRGYGLLLILAGFCISISALFLYRQSAIKELEYVSKINPE